jgi:hypothetical protein
MGVRSGSAESKRKSRPSSTATASSGSVTGANGGEDLTTRVHRPVSRARGGLAVG